MFIPVAFSLCSFELCFVAGAESLEKVGWGDFLESVVTCSSRQISASLSGHRVRIVGID